MTPNYDGGYTFFSAKYLFTCKTILRFPEKGIECIEIRVAELGTNIFNSYDAMFVERLKIKTIERDLMLNGVHFPSNLHTTKDKLKWLANQYYVPIFNQGLNTVFFQKSFFSPIINTFQRISNHFLSNNLHLTQDLPGLKRFLVHVPFLHACFILDSNARQNRLIEKLLIEQFNDCEDTPTISTNEHTEDIVNQPQNITPPTPETSKSSDTHDQAEEAYPNAETVIFSALADALSSIEGVENFSNIKDAGQVYTSDPKQTTENVQQENSNENAHCEELKANFKVILQALYNKIDKCRKALDKCNKSTDSIRIKKLEEAISKQQESISIIQETFENINGQNKLKETIKTEQNYLLEHKDAQIKIYYQTLLSNLCSFFHSIALVNNDLSILSIDQGKGTQIANNVQKNKSIPGKEEQITQLNALGNRLCSVGDHLIEVANLAKPAINLIAGLVSGITSPIKPEFAAAAETIGKMATIGIDTIVGMNDHHKINRTSTVFRGLTPKKLEKIADEIARKIAFSYEEQIMLLSEEGAILFAEYAHKCIAGALLNDLFTQPDLVTQAWLSVRILDTRQNITILGHRIPFTTPALQGIELNKSFRAYQLYRHSGIAIIDDNGRHPCILKPEENKNFGYFRISRKQLDAYFPLHIECKGPVSSTNTTPTQASKNNFSDLENKEPSPKPVQTDKNNNFNKLGATDSKQLYYPLLDRISQLEEQGKQQQKEIAKLGGILKNIINGDHVDITHIRSSVSPSTTPITNKNLANCPIGIENIVNGDHVDITTIRSSVSPSATPITNQTLANCPIGMENIGNSCYMNATLQALFRIPMIRAAIMTKTSPQIEFMSRAQAEYADRKQKVKIALGGVLNSSKVALPANLRLLRQAVFNFHLFQDPINATQDAEEFMNCILNSIDYINILSTNRFMLPSSNNTTPNPWDKNDVLSYLSVAINDSKIPQNFSEVLENYFSEEHKDETLEWADKSKVTKWSQVSKLTTLPEHLIIQLKRFKCNGHITAKIRTPIKFPHNGLVDLSCALFDNSPAQYEIVSYINHLGNSLHTGHYTAHVKDEHNKWHHCDDMYVKPCNPKKPDDSGSFTSNHPYIIILKRIQD